MPLAAQEYAIPEPESNTSLSTEANFATDVDNFLHLHNWGDVAFDKFFSYAGFRAYSGGNDDFFAYELNAGYARRFGSLYLGLFYAGQISEAGDAWEKTAKTKTTTNGLTGGTYQKEKEQNTTEQGETGDSAAAPVVPSTPNDPPRFYNNIGALIGVAGMGIRVGFYETLWGSSKYIADEDPNNAGPGWASGDPLYESDITDNADGSKSVFEITDYNRLKGWVVPYLGWGMKLSMGGLTIKPKANLDLALFVDEEKYSQAGYYDTVPATPVYDPNESVNGTPVGATYEGKSYKDNGYFSLGINVGADVDFASIGSHSFGAGLGYTITPDIYSHKFDTASGDDMVSGTVSAINSTRRTVGATQTETINESTVTATEISRVNHVINPSFWYVNELSETISLGLNYDLAFTIGTDNQHKKITTTTITDRAPHNSGVSTHITSVKVEDSSAVDETTFAVDSAIGAGFSWQIKPGRFTLNAGLGIKLPAYESVTTHDKPTEATITKENTTYSNGSETAAITIDPAKAVTVTDKTTVEQTWTGVSATYSLGGTFYFTPNFLVDMYFNSLSGTEADGSAKIDLINNGFKYSMLFTLKY
jgi:hypothetical protein